MFSVIIPTYNRAEKLKRALNSLVNQTFTDFEVIVCDDGSKDNTKEIVKQFEKNLNIKYLYEENWGGPARPRNNGIKAANRDWICFLDADDWWTENKLEVVSKFTKDNDLIYHRLLKFDEKSNEIIGKINSRNLGRNALFDLLKSLNPIPMSSVTVKREFLEVAGGFSEDKNLIASEDFDLWLRLVNKGVKFHLIKKYLGHYSLSSDNISSDKNKAIIRNQILVTKYSQLLSEKKKSDLYKIHYEDFSLVKNIERIKQYVNRKKGKIIF